TKAFYVDTLTLTSGTTLQLNGLNIYYNTLNLNGGVISGGNAIMMTAGAAELAFVGDNATYNWSAAGTWSPTQVPGSTDVAHITNSITGVTTITNSAAATTIAGLVISNSSAANHVVLLSNNTLSVTMSNVIGRNGVVQIGSGPGTGTVSASLLFLVDNGT